MPLWNCDFQGCRTPALQGHGDCLLCERHLCRHHLRAEWHDCPDPEVKDVHALPTITSSSPETVHRLTMSLPAQLGRLLRPLCGRRSPPPLAPFRAHQRAEAAGARVALAEWHPLYSGPVPESAGRHDGRAKRPRRHGVRRRRQVDRPLPARAGDVAPAGGARLHSAERGGRPAVSARALRRDPLPQWSTTGLAKRTPGTRSDWATS